LALKHFGQDPYRLFHGLDERYVPLDDPGGEPQPPAYPTRLRFFMYACALVAEGEPVKAMTVQPPQSGGGPQRRRSGMPSGG
jgi:hypothetical protein